jgi:hypothetical protein
MKKLFLLILPFFFSNKNSATIIIAKGNMTAGQWGVAAYCDPTSSGVCNRYEVNDNRNDTFFCQFYNPNPIMVNGNLLKQYDENGILRWQGNALRIELSQAGNLVKYTIIK